jgi:arylsulfatase A-like enzyme
MKPTISELIVRSAAVAGLLAALFISTPARAESDRPNVIILMPDQMRGQAMGVAGEAQIRAPHIDRLARQGVYLPNTIANTPVCCPARATILTGQYPHRHGLITNDLRLRESAVTLAELLAKAGYATGFVGKWHLDGGLRMPGFVPPGERRQGFAFWAANECNHDHYNSIYFHDTPDPIPIKRFEPEVWMDEAVDFIRKNRTGPFMLFWACGPPHNPYAAPPEYEKLYNPDSLKLPPNWQTTPKFGSRADIARYYAAITAIDDQVGRLMGELDQLGLADNTLVLFISDHGDMLGAHGQVFKSKPWEESIRVPGIIRHPRTLKPGQVRDLLFSHVDIAPTVLGYCGLPVPANMQGRDLSRQIQGRGGDEPDAVFIQYYEPRPHEDVPAGWRGLRTKTHTYARLRDRPWMLYDLTKDPYELNNLADKPQAADLQRRLDRLLVEEMTRTSDDWNIDLTEPRIFYNAPAVYIPGQSTAPAR